MDKTTRNPHTVAEFTIQSLTATFFFSDLAIPGNLLLAGGGEEQAHDCSRLEMSLAERYKDRKSEDNKRIREEFRKVLKQSWP